MQPVRRQPTISTNMPPHGFAHALPEALLCNQRDVNSTITDNHSVPFAYRAHAGEGASANIAVSTSLLPHCNRQHKFAPLGFCINETAAFPAEEKNVTLNARMLEAQTVAK